MIPLGCATVGEKARVIGDKQFVPMTMFDSPEGSLDLEYGNCQWLYPHDEPTETLLAQPQYESAKPVYFAAKYGDAADNIHTMVVDESGGTGSGHDQVYIDVDNDNRIDGEKEQFDFNPDPETREDLLRVKMSVRVGATTIPYHFSFMAFPYTDENHPVEQIHANARNSGYYVGEAMIGGQSRKIALADLNSNGLFDDPEGEGGRFSGDRIFVDMDGDGEFHGEWEESFPYGGYTRIQREWYSFVATPDGTVVEVARVEPRLGTVATNQGCYLVLRSPSQAVSLDLFEGPDNAVVGTYKPAEVRLIVGPTLVHLRGVFPKEVAPVVVRPGKRTVCKLGGPITASIDVCSTDEPECLGLDLTTAGIGGERYRLLGGFEIQDERGDVVLSDEFEYG
jgi:hypothetical protein